MIREYAASSVSAILIETEKQSEFERTEGDVTRCFSSTPPRDFIAMKDWAS
jgi:hypothetical protein